MNKEQVGTSNNSATNVIDIQRNLPHRVSNVICLKCLKRWLAIRPTTVKLTNLECDCGQIGFVIETGEILSENPNE